MKFQSRLNSGLGGCDYSCDELTRAVLSYPLLLFCFCVNVKSYM